MHDLFFALFFVGLLLLPSTLGEYFLEKEQQASSRSTGLAEQLTR